VIIRQYDPQRHRLLLEDALSSWCIDNRRSQSQ
jgi:hypothetical protein